ncbi:MAG: molybdenum cofactor guanylyltransferase [bacterium]|jgi:molybdopterin-guanine dinucleotide biosynthesis protein A|nr:molybdenum cofactor guanylyltransferase [Bacillota bacterium]
MAGIILAGGKGKRFGGSNKAFRELAGKPLLEWVRERLAPLFPEIILVTNTPELYSSFPGRVVTDLHPHRGPLGGIEAGLLAAGDPVSFVTGCDMPFLCQSLIRKMQDYTRDYDVVVPRLGSYIEPLHAFYSRQTLPLIQQLLREGNYKMSSLLAAPLKVYYVNEAEIKALDPEGLSFFNVNTPADLARALKIIEKEAGGSESCRYS